MLTIPFVGVVWFIVDIVTTQWAAISVAGLIAAYIVGMWVVVPRLEGRGQVRGSGRTNASA